MTLEQLLAMKKSELAEEVLESWRAYQEVCKTAVEWHKAYQRRGM